jgi:hypothetical protein
MVDKDQHHKNVVDKEYYKVVHFKCADDDNTLHTLGPYNILLRMFFSLMVNSVYRTMILITLPVMPFEVDAQTLLLIAPPCPLSTALTPSYHLPAPFRITSQVQLSRSSDEMDFVLNSFAILFIAAIDDMPDLKTFNIDFDGSFDYHGAGAYGMAFFGLQLSECKSIYQKLQFVNRVMWGSWSSNPLTPDGDSTPDAGTAYDGDSTKGLTRQRGWSKFEKRPSQKGTKPCDEGSYNISHADGSLI